MYELLSESGATKINENNIPLVKISSKILSMFEFIIAKITINKEKVIIEYKVISFL